ncbi:hypothetical protein M758_2G197800 [Ceratodon purpureus]|nr:hypothetical protein M758_2G197800 [Ceratodon purpureus]
MDPAKLVRMMLPMSIQCNTCGSLIYNGTKFNSRKEVVQGETYMDIQIFRFSFKCTNCSATLIMKTDPRNSSYIMEAGSATLIMRTDPRNRNYIMEAGASTQNISFR